MEIYKYVFKKLYEMWGIKRKKKVDDTNIWKHRLCSLIGRINIVKMTTTQGNLKIQCNPYQITKNILHGTRIKYFKICMETQKTPNSQSIIEKERQKWRNLVPWPQTLLQSYSYQNSMVLAQKQNYRSMEQDRRPRNKPENL